MGRSTVVKEISEIRTEPGVRGLLSEEQDFQLNAVRDRERVEMLKDVGEVVMGGVAGEEACSRVLDVSQFWGDFRW